LTGRDHGALACFVGRYAVVAATQTASSINATVTNAMIPFIVGLALPCVAIP
jgi:hypothetical protein